MDKFDFTKLIVAKNGFRVRCVTTKEYKELPSVVKSFNATDYASFMGCERMNNTKSSIIRPMDSLVSYSSAYGLTQNKGTRLFSFSNGVAPVIELAIPGVTEGFDDSNPQTKAEFDKIISQMTTQNHQFRELHFIEMGEYPQTLVSEEQEEELERLYQDGKMTPTGRLFSTTSGSNMGRSFDPEFEYRGEKYVRLTCRAYPSQDIYRNDGDKSQKVRLITIGNYWVKVEPIKFYVANYDELPTSINPNGTGKANTITLISQRALTSGMMDIHELPLQVEAEGFENLDEYNENASQSQISALCRVINRKSDAMCFLNGCMAYGANPEADFSVTGGFLNEAFNLTQEFDKTLVINTQDLYIYGFEVAGLEYYDTIVVDRTSYIFSNVWQENGFKYGYVIGDDLYLSKNVPQKALENNIPVVNFCDADICFNELSSPFYIASTPMIDSLVKKLKKTKVRFPIEYFSYETEEGIKDLIENGNFHFAYEASETLGADFKYLEVLQFMQTIGCFSNKRMVDRSGKETDILIAQKACSFFCRLYKGKNNFMDFVLNNDYKYNYNISQEFLSFLMVKNEKGEYENLNLIESICSGNRDLYMKIASNFDEVKKLRKGLDRNGLPFTRSWKESLLLFSAQNIYSDYSPENGDIAKLFISHGVEEEHFQEAVELRQKAKSMGIRHSILETPLREKTILEQIEDIKESTAGELKVASKELTNVYEKTFTFEMLDKHDPINYIIGLFVDCCCTITSAFYGGKIARNVATHNDVQNMVLRNAKGEIVGKATLYVSEATRSAVFNEFDLSEKYLDSAKYRKRALIAFLRGTKAFIEAYDREHSDAPLQKVHVGTGFNKLLEELKGFEQSDKEWAGDDVRIPSELSFKDAEEGQIILYRRGRTGIQGINMFDDEPESEPSEIIDSY